MSIHGLLQEPASYPSNFITLPFTIQPSSQNYGQQSFQAIVRTLDKDGNVPVMTANTDFEVRQFDLGINVMLSNITVTIHLDDSVDYDNVQGFGMIAWDYSAITDRIVIQTFNFSAVNITNWRIEVIAFPIVQGGLWPVVRATDQNTSESLFMGTEITGVQPVPAWIETYPPFSFNDNTITIGKNGWLFVSEDAGNLLAIADSGNTGTLVWSFDTGYAALTSPALGLDDTLYLGGNNSMAKINNIESFSPAQVWIANLTPLTNPLSPLISYPFDYLTNPLAVASVYIGGTNGKVYALNDLGSSFTYRWVFTTGGATMNIALNLDGTVLYVTNQLTLYAVDTITGLIIWQRNIGATTLSPPTVSDDGTIYVFGSTTITAIVNLTTTSAVKWSLAITGNSGNLTRSISYGGNFDRLYLVTNNQILAVTDNGSSATQNWIYTINPALAPSVIQAPTISLDGTLYTTGDFSLFVCVTDNGATVTQNWAFQQGGGFASQPTIGVFKRIYFGNDQTGIIAF